MKAFMCTERAKTAHEYELLTPDLRPRATCGKLSDRWIQDLYPAASIGGYYGRPSNQDDPIYCPKCLAH